MLTRSWMNVALVTLLLAGCEVSVEPSDSARQNGAATNSNAGATKPLFPQGGAATTATTGATRGGLQFVERFEAGYEKATAEGKPMLVFFTAEWCHFCHQMADEAFRNPQVIGLSNQFVCIMVDADAEPEVCRKFRVQGYPTVQFLSPRGVPLNRLVGKKPSHQVMMAMQAALQNVARKVDADATKLR